MDTKEALEWIADLFEEPVENLSNQTTQEEVPGWDSLGVLTLMAALDEEFDIILEDEELWELKKIEDILKVLKKHGQLT
jgi:acyl carrier protein